MLSVNHQYDDIGQARDALIEGDIYAILTIPHGFDKAVVKSLRPEVTLFYNSQYILVGRLINSAALQAQGTFNAQVEVVKALAKGNTTGAAAMGKAVNVRTQITPLFNKGTNYAQFLVSAIVPAIWQIAVVSFTVLVLSANYRISGLAPWLGQEKTHIKIGTDLVPLFPLVLVARHFLFSVVLRLNWMANGRKLAGALLCTDRYYDHLYDNGSTVFLLNLRCCTCDEFCGRIYRTKFCVYGNYFSSDRHESPRVILA